LDLKSESPTAVVVAKRRAFSLRSSIVTTMPFFWAFRTQFVRALSMSTPLPLPLRLTGELLRSSEFRYFSLFRRTLDTVLPTMLERDGR
jgi:hypothetical protein